MSTRLLAAVSGTTVETGITLPEKQHHSRLNRIRIICKTYFPSREINWNLVYLQHKKKYYFIFYYFLINIQGPALLGGKFQMFIK